MWVKLKSLFKEIALRLRVLAATLAWGGGLRGETVPVGRLNAVKITPDGKRTDLGLISTRVVTDAGVDAIVDAFQNSVELENFTWHGSGTGTTAEAAGDTALGTEVASRTDGSATENGSNTFRTVGTISYSSSHAITEHGLFSASTGGTLMDRSVFSAINVANGDSIEFTYDLTFPSGS